MFNLVSLALFTLLLLVLLAFTNEFEFYDIAGLAVAFLGGRNIVAYHFNQPYWWWYGNRGDLKNNTNFQKKIYISNYAIFFIGAMYMFSELFPFLYSEG